jgi:hypothetical protein
MQAAMVRKNIKSIYSISIRKVLIRQCLLAEFRQSGALRSAEIHNLFDVSQPTVLSHWAMNIPRDNASPNGVNPENG